MLMGFKFRLFEMIKKQLTPPPFWRWRFALFRSPITPALHDSKGQATPSERDSSSTDLRSGLKFRATVRAVGKFLLEGLATTVATYDS